MFPTIALIAAVAIAPVQAAPAAAGPTGPFDALTANYHLKTGQYCIRSGWRTATHMTGRPVRAGECARIEAWHARGLTFETVDRAKIKAARAIDVAAR